LPSFPVNLFAFGAPPELLLSLFFVLPLDLIHCLSFVNDDQFGSVALDASRKRLEFTQIDLEELSDFLEHLVTVCPLFYQVNGDFVVFPLEKL